MFVTMRCVYGRTFRIRFGYSKRHHQRARTNHARRLGFEGMRDLRRFLKSEEGKALGAH